MIKLGQYNTLRITRFTDHGAYLDGGTVGEILMPKPMWSAACVRATR